MDYNYIYTKSIDGVGSELFQITRNVRITSPLLTFARYCFRPRDTSEYFSHFILLHYLECRDKIGFGIYDILEDLENIDFKGDIPKSQERFKKYLTSFRKLYKNKPDSITTLDYYLNLLRFKSVDSFVDSQELVLWLVCGLHMISDKGYFLNAVSALVNEYDTVFGRLFIDIGCCIFNIPFNRIRDLCKDLPCLSHSICDVKLTFETGTLKELIISSLKEYNNSIASSCDEKPKRSCKVSYKKIKPKSLSNTSNNVLHFESVANNTKSFVKRSINFGNSFSNNFNSCVIGNGVSMVTNDNGTTINSKIKIPAGHNVSVVDGKVYVDDKFYCDLNDDKVESSSSNTKKYELTDNTIIYKGVVLHQIRALQNFNNVKAGDLGGFIEKESNLSQKGICWVYDSAKVYGGVKLMGTSVVSDEAVVTGTASIKACVIEDNSMFNASGDVEGVLLMYDDSYLSGDVNIMGNLTMTDSSSIRGSIDCAGKIVMTDSSSIKDTLNCSGTLSMSDDSSMSGSSSIYGMLSMCDDTAVKNTIVYGVADLCDDVQVSNSAIYSVLSLKGHRIFNNFKG